MFKGGWGNEKAFLMGTSFQFISGLNESNSIIDINK